MMGPTWQPPACRDCALAPVCKIKAAAVDFWIRWHYSGVQLQFDQCMMKLPKERVTYAP